MGNRLKQPGATRQAAEDAGGTDALSAADRIARVARSLPGWMAGDRRAGGVYGNAERGNPRASLSRRRSVEQTNHASTNQERRRADRLLERHGDDGFRFNAGRRSHRSRL